ERRRVPDRCAASHRMRCPCRPAFGADLARCRQRERPPQDLSGLRVERCQAPTNPELAACHAGVDDAVIIARPTRSAVSVVAFIANTSALPVTTYMMPSFTSGVASAEYLPPMPDPLRRVIQAPLSCFTLSTLICFSVE